MTWDKKFFTSKGRLNRYALACGYQEHGMCESNGNLKHVSLYMDGSVLHVRAYDRLAGKNEEYVGYRMHEARQVFARKLKEYGLKRIPNQQ